MKTTRDPPDGDSYFSFQNLKPLMNREVFSPELRLSTYEVQKELYSLAVVSAETVADHESYEHCFHLWQEQLLSGLNILVVGVGSKRKLLQRFAEDLEDGIVLEADGLVGNNLTELIRCISIGFLGLNNSKKSDYDILHDIRVVLEDKTGPEIFLIIQHIDSERYANTSSQKIFSLLGRIKRIHIIATADHVQHPFLLDPEGSWIWHTVNTFRPYLAELTLFNERIITSSHYTNILRQSAISVLNTVPNKAVKLFLILAKHYVANPDTEGLPGEEYFAVAKKSLVVTSKQQFETSLREFIDHKVISKKKLSLR